MSSEVLDILLAGTPRNVERELPEKDYKILRLSKELGQDVVFRLRALSYSRAAELAVMPDMDAAAVLDGVVSPNLRDERLAVKYGLLKQGEHWMDHGVTPLNLVKSVLLPGEIKEISTKVQLLSGYMRPTMQEVIKKN